MSGAPASLVGPAARCVVDEDAPHGTSGNRKKVDATLPHNLLQSKAKVGFVHECCGIERMSSPLVSQFTMRDPLQLVVDEWQ